MLDLLHLIRLLRGALESLVDTSERSDRDRVTRKLIADLQATLEHSELDPRESRSLKRTDVAIADRQSWSASGPARA